MDHEWGRNVLGLGVGDCGATLAARSLGSPYVYITNARDINGRWLRWQQHPSDTNVPMTPVWFLPRPGHPHFPFGEPVVPDAPV